MGLTSKSTESLQQFTELHFNHLSLEKCICHSAFFDASYTLFPKYGFLEVWQLYKQNQFAHFLEKKSIKGKKHRSERWFWVFCSSLSWKTFSGSVTSVRSVIFFPNLRCIEFFFHLLIHFINKNWNIWKKRERGRVFAGDRWGDRCILEWQMIKAKVR